MIVYLGHSGEPNEPIWRFCVCFGPSRDAPGGLSELGRRINIFSQAIVGISYPMFDWLPQNL